MQSTVRTYHRRSRRITLRQPLRLRPSSPRGELFDEITNTTNISREGFYFCPQRDHYQVGIRLLVTLPYHCPRDRGDREYLAQVVRVELLDEGQRGVAIELLSLVGISQ
jgi:hypothetical protein